MQSSEFGPREPATSRSLREAIRQARLKEAMTIDEAAGRRSSELARLEVLKAALEHIFEEIPEGDDRFELALVQSVPARLWIDIFTYVVMDPGSQAYRLVRNRRGGRRVLIETRDLTDMAERITAYVAQQIIVRERQIEGLMEPESSPAAVESRPSQGRSRAGIAAAGFVIGVLTGMFGLFALGYLITM